MTSSETVIEVRNLKTYFYTYEGVVRAVDGVSFSLERGKTIGIIGESGSGKSVTAQSILRLTPSPPSRIVDGEIILHAKDGGTERTIDIAKLDPKGASMRSIRGREIAMIFQEPMTSFGPLQTIGWQIMEAMRVHNPQMKKNELRERAVELLGRVGIPRPDQRVDGYPHMFSGGMLQRAMIAMALSCSPRLLIADEPTTAVDVTIQAQLLDLLDELQAETGMAVILITHNLAVVTDIADEILVMYLGRVLEQALVQTIVEQPMHPYTRALWRSIPQIEGELLPLEAIKGSVPSPYEVQHGCPFFERCEERDHACDPHVAPPMVDVGPHHRVSCTRHFERHQSQEVR